MLGIGYNSLNETFTKMNKLKLTGVYIGPADMRGSYGLQPRFDVKEDPIYSNIKYIVKKTKEYGKIAGIHNGSTTYAKEMISMGYQFVTISSDFRAMSTYAKEILDDMKGEEKNKNITSY